MHYEAVFSVGSNCTPAYQLSRFFHRKTHGCFDWIVTPLSSIAKILEDDGQSFCQNISPCFEGFSAVCDKYGVLYHHEFKRDAANTMLITADQMSLARSKLIYKYRKMFEIAKTRATLFIRYGAGTDAPGDPLTATADDMRALAALLGKKIGHDSFKILYVHHDGFPFERPSFRESELSGFSFYRDKFQPEVLGTNAVWDDIFANMGLVKDADIFI